MKWVLIVLGILLLLMGAVWALQGTNILAYGQMAGDNKWTIIGSVVGVVGIILIVLGARLRKARA